jgi:flagellar hook-length control protein FliK
VSVAVINISLSDLLNAPETLPVAPTRTGDAAAFTGLLDQFDRRQTEAAPKPARSRAERTTTAAQDDEANKTPRGKSPIAAKAKPDATIERDAAPLREDTAVQGSSKENAAEARADVTSDQAADAKDEQVLDTAAAQTIVAAVVVEEPLAPQVVLSLPSTVADDAIAGSAAAPADLTADSNDQTDALDPLASSLSAKAAEKANTPTAQMPTADSPATAADDAPAAPPPSPAAQAQAQAADMSKRLESLPLQVAVQLGHDDMAKPLKTPVALANGMSHSSQSEATTAVQTAAAAPSIDETATATIATSDTPDVQATVPSATQSATATFAALIEAASDKPSPTIGKSAAGETATIGALTASSPTTANQAVPGAAQAAKPAPLPHPATEQVAVHIAKAAADGADKIHVKLKPASLGQVDVQLDIAADGRVQVVVSADRAETLDLLQRDARGLERALNDAGLQMDQQSMSFNLRDQGMAQNRAGSETTDRGDWQNGAEGGDEPTPAIGGYLNARAAVGGVDIRV